MSVIYLFITGFVYSLNVTSYSLYFSGDIKHYEDNTYFYSSIFLNRNQRTERNTRVFTLSVSKNLRRGFSLSTSLDKKIEKVSSEMGESKGGRLSLSYTPGLLNLRTYVEAVNIRKDSSISNLGYGLTAYKIFHAGKLNSMLDIALSRFDVYKKHSAGVKMEYESGNKKINGGMFFTLFDVPYGIHEKDNRRKSNAYLNLYASLKGVNLVLFGDVTSQRSSKMLNLNFRDLNAGGRLKERWQGSDHFGINAEINMQKKLKIYYSGGREEILKYGITGRAYYQKLYIDADILMKRYDFVGLIPLDRDERLLSISGGIGAFSFKYTRTDINYIKREYEGNSDMEENYILEYDAPIYEFYKSRISYSGQLFAGMELPIYSNKKGYYQRYWKNSLYVSGGDSSYTFGFLLKYRQIGEFSGDSLYKPLSSMELATDGSFRVAKKRNVSVYCGESVHFIFGRGFREWHVTVKMDTGRYTLTLGIGRLAGREDSFVEFKSWI